MVLALMSVREKVAFLLQKEAEAQNTLSITLPRSRQEIADSFGIQKFSLKRVLTEMANEGTITINGREVTILRPGNLK